MRDPLYLGSEIMARTLLRTPSPAHREVAQAMVEQRNILYVDHRGTCKTTLVDEIGSVYQLLRFHDDRILFLQWNEQNGKMISEMVRNHFVKNDVLREVFPEFAMRTNEEIGNILSWSVPCRTANTAERSFTVGTPGASLTGLHFEVIKATDLMNTSTTPPPCGLGTVETMKAVIDWYASTNGLLVSKKMCPRAHRTYDSNRWHDGDHVAQLVRDDKDDKFLKVLCGVKRDDDGRFIATWPEVIPSEELHAIESDPTMTAATWAANYCSDPLPEGGMAFRRDWFHIYGENTLCPVCSINHPEPSELTVGITVDPAFSDGQVVKKQNSRSAIIAAGVSPRPVPNLYVLGMQAGQWTPHDTVERIYNMVDVWRVRDTYLWVGIEETGGSRGIISIFHQRMMNSGQFVPYRTIKPGTRRKDDPQRMGPLHAHAENMGIYVRPGMEELVEELLRFGVAERNDLADALAMRAMELYAGQEVRRKDDEETEPEPYRLHGRDYLDLDRITEPRGKRNVWDLFGSLN